MKKYLLHQFALVATLLGLSAIAWAVPTSGPYVTDPQHEYVQDATSEAIGSLNMVLCIMNALNVNDSGMLNVGPYIALVDMNKCDSKGSASDSSGGASGASAAKNYMNAVVDATRASSSDPMIAKVWMSMTDHGQKTKIWVKVTATQSPTEVPPYGVFRMDFIGKDAGNNSTQFNGFIDSAVGTIQYYETGQNSSNVALIMTAPQSTTSGSGSMTVGGNGMMPAASYDFNYNTDYFRRSDGTHDQCFDRTKANAKRSVWRLGTYDATTGERMDQANPGFPLTATYAGTTYYGFANYYGINFQGLDLNAIDDANPIIGLEVSDQRPNNSSTYTLSKVTGKLTKWTRSSSTLADMDGIPFTFGGDMTGKTTGNVAVTSWGQWQMKWNNTAGNFTITGTQACGGSNGCVITEITPVATVNNNAFDGMPLSGWSDSFGGNINIPPTTAPGTPGTPHTGSDPVYFFTQSLVLPGSNTAPAALHCINNCPDATSVAAANAYTTGTAGSPYGGSTGMQWFSAPDTAHTVDYTFDSAGLKHGTTAMIITNAAYFAASPMYQNGLMTGRMFATALDNTDCPNWVVSGSVCEPSNPTEYYTWSTGTGQWNQSMWLTKTSDSTVVVLDPPQNIPYVVPIGTAYGDWAGKTIQLQFNGFGNLWGVPGYCVNPVDNSPVDCSTPNTRYVPMFSIPDAATMTLNSTSMIVKALDAELRLNDLGAGATECSGMTLSTATPPSGGELDVSPGGADSIGNKPVVTDPPKVIDGVVQ